MELTKSNCETNNIQSEELLNEENDRYVIFPIKPLAPVIPIFANIK